MSNAQIFHRLTIRFTNGETSRFILREPLDASRAASGARFLVVRTSSAEGETDVYMANLADLSYVKSERIEAKETRQRVAGLMAGIVTPEDGPETVSTVEFV